MVGESEVRHAPWMAGGRVVAVPVDADTAWLAACIRERLDADDRAVGGTLRDFQRVVRALLVEVSGLSVPARASLPTYRAGGAAAYAALVARTARALGVGQYDIRAATVTAGRMTLPTAHARPRASLTVGSVLVVGDGNGTTGRGRVVAWNPRAGGDTVTVRVDPATVAMRGRPVAPLATEVWEAGR